MQTRTQSKDLGIRHWSTALVSACLVVPVAFFNFDLFHVLIELFAIGVALMSFVVVWHTQSIASQRFYLFLGCGYLSVGLLDLGHTLTFRNLIGLHGVTPSLTLEYWISARFVEAAVILTAPFVAQRHLNSTQILALPLTLALFLFGIIHLGHFPQMIDPLHGLSGAKLFAEYLIIAILIVSIQVYRRKRSELGDATTHLIILCCALTIGAELCFTLYTELSEWPVIVGHLLKFFSFWAVYRLLIDSSLLQPLDNLSRIVDSYDSVKDQTAIVNQEGIILRANRALTDLHGSDLVGQHCHDVMHPKEFSQSDCPICQSISSQSTLQAYEFRHPETGSWYEARVSGIHIGDQFSAMIHSLQEINLRKKAEAQYQNLNRLYQVHSHVNQAIAKSTDQTSLFAEICRVAVEQGRFKMVWIGYIEDSVVSPKFWAGEETGYLSDMQMRIDDSDWAKGPVGISAKTKRVSCINNVDTDPNFGPWRAAAQQRGYGALAAVPITLGDQVISIFTLYSHSKDVFDQQMTLLLETISKDLSGAVENLRQRELTRQAEQSVSKLSSAVEQSSVGTIMADADGRIEYMNPRFCELMDIRYQDLIGKDHRSLIPCLWSQSEYDSLFLAMQSEDIWQREIQSKTFQGEEIWLLQTASIVRNEQGDITHYVVNASDNTQLREAHETIEQLAFYDPLTSLPNRRLLIDRLEHAIANAIRHRELVAVMMCDLDNFKTVNDSLGHDVGDALLQSVADTFKQATREVDTVSRLGGDEFVIVLEAISEVEDIVSIAKNIQSKLCQTIDLNGTQVSVSSSIGIAIAPQDGQTTTEIMRNADLAMYHAKDQGKNDFKFFQQEMNDKAQGRLQLENKLRNALVNDEFYLVYQPQVEMKSGNIIGVETLIRWEHPIDGNIPPDQFIPLAEQAGIIEQIGAWVVAQAIKDWSDFHHAGLQGLRMAVNFSGKQFSDSKTLLKLISDNMAPFPELRVQDFTVEITESTLIHNIEETIRILEHLKELGVEVSIDDFGTGYSSLSYLKQFPIDQLKIDKSFVQDLSSDISDQAIISAIIAIAQELDIKIIAEGVESREQQNILTQKGCSIAQGYKYYKPMRKEELIKLSLIPRPLSQVAKQ